MWTIKTKFIPIRPQSILVSGEKALLLAAQDPHKKAPAQCEKIPGMNSFGLKDR